MAKRLGHQLAKIAAFSSGLRLLKLGLSLVVSVLLTRSLGVDGYGAYAYAVSWVLLLNILASLGCQGLLVREIAANREQEKWGLIRGLLQWTNSIVLLCSLVIVGLFALTVWQVIQTPNPQVLYTLLIALVLIPLTALTVARQAALQGFKHVLQGQLSEAVIEPIAFIIFLSIAYLFWEDISSPQAMALKVISTTIAFLFGIWALLRVIPSEVKQAKAEYDSKRWLPSLLSLLFMAGIGTIYTRTDTIMLGMISGTGTVGLYVIALRLANFILMSQQVGVSVLGPHVASLYAKGEIRKLQELTTKSIRAVVAYALPVTLIFIFLGDRLLSIFGSDFSEAHTILIILSIGKLLNASTGAVGLLLNMTHHEKDNAMVVGVSAVLNIGLNLLLIPQFGAVGAAIATVSTSVTANVWLAILVYKRIGIQCTVIGNVLKSAS